MGARPLELFSSKPEITMANVNLSRMTVEALMDLRKRVDETLLKWHLTAPNADNSDQIRLPKKRNGQHSAGLLVLKNYGREARLDGHVRNVHGPPLQGRQPRRSLPSRREPRTHELLGKFWRPVTGCLSYENASVISTEQREVALAEARCVGEDSVEHGSKVRR